MVYMYISDKLRLLYSKTLRFAALPRDLLRYYVAPMTMYPHSILCGHAGTLLVRDECERRHLAGRTLGYIDWFVPLGDDKWLVANSRSWLVAGTSIDIYTAHSWEHLLLQSNCTFAYRIAHNFCIGQLKLGSGPYTWVRHKFIINGVPPQYKQVVLCHIRDDHNELVLWDGDRNIARVIHAPTSVNVREYRLGITPVSISESPDGICLTYSWGEMVDTRWSDMIPL